MMILESSFKKNLNIFLIIFTSIFLVSAKPYTSQFLFRETDSENVKSYYPGDIQHISEGASPQLINYVSSRNIKKHGEILVQGILFTYKNEKARKVLFTSGIDNFMRHQMNRNQKGVWFYVLVMKPYQAYQHGKELRYRFIVDNIFINDPNASQEVDSLGEFISAYNYREHTPEPIFGVIPLKRKTAHTKEFLFRVCIPNTDRVSLIGNFNHWNQDLDIMQEIEEDIFEIRKFLPHGKYIYLYKAKGEYHIDTFNHQKRFHKAYGKVSYLQVK